MREAMDSDVLNFEDILLNHKRANEQIFKRVIGEESGYRKRGLSNRDRGSRRLSQFSNWNDEDDDKGFNRKLDNDRIKSEYRIEEKQSEENDKNKMRS